MKNQVLTGDDINKLLPGSPCYVLEGTIVTALARELATQRQNMIIECENLATIVDLKPRSKRIAMSSDKACRTLKSQLGEFLERDGYLVLDCGDDLQDNSCHPCAGLRVASAVSIGDAYRAVAIESAGSGSYILANKMPGIRAALCYDRLSATNSRKYDDANFLALSLEASSIDQMKIILSTWLDTPFDGDRYQYRVARIEELENQLLKSSLVAIPGDCSCAL